MITTAMGCRLLTRAAASLGRRERYRHPEFNALMAGQVTRSFSQSAHRRDRSSDAVLNAPRGGGRWLPDHAGAADAAGRAGPRPRRRRVSKDQRPGPPGGGLSRGLRVSSQRIGFLCRCWISARGASRPKPAVVPACADLLRPRRLPDDAGHGRASAGPPPLAGYARVPGPRLIASALASVGSRQLGARGGALLRTGRSKL
jgi:hypothetical protein